MVADSHAPGSARRAILLYDASHACECGRAARLPDGPRAPYATDRHEAPMTTTALPCRCLRALAFAGACAVLLAACAAQPPRASTAELQRQVADTERAFAKSMADRDFAAFTSFLAQDTVFFTGPSPLRGKEAVAAVWKRFYEKPEPPFAWEPQTVEVLDAGDLAISTGPVRNAAGRLIATFTSIWRQESPGVWRIVFDKGNEVCDCAKAP
jgi:ketosteroid isomerase-like protein